jgi:hypothetical protein
MKSEHLSIHGHRLAFRTAGEGPVVLLIHGMAGSSETWKHVLPALAQRFTVIAPDLLGHGESGKPARCEYSLGAHANVLRDLLNALAARRRFFQLLRHLHQLLSPSWSTRELLTCASNTPWGQWSWPGGCGGSDRIGDPVTCHDAGWRPPDFVSMN